MQIPAKMQELNYVSMINESNKISAAIITDGADIEKLRKCVYSVFSSCFEVVICANNNFDLVQDTFKNYKKVKVYSQVWEHDFSKARNEAMSLCSGDWIFVIDSDEELMTPIQYLDEKFDVYSVVINNPLSEDKKIIEQHRNFRISKKSADLTYRHSIHESVTEDIIEKQLSVCESQIQIKHAGYLDEQELKHKSKRNTDALLALPEGLHRDYYLFRQYVTDRNYSEALDLGFKILNIEQADNQLKAGICSMLSTVYLIGYGATNEAKLMLIQSLKYEPMQIYARFFLIEELARDRSVRAQTFARQQMQIMQQIIYDKSSKLNSDLIFTREHFEKLKQIIQSWQ